MFRLQALKSTDFESCRAPRDLSDLPLVVFEPAPGFGRVGFQSVFAITEPRSRRRYTGTRLAMPADGVNLHASRTCDEPAGFLS